MKLYLVESYRADIEFDEDSLVVALTPEACYSLDKSGIDYSIIEDYYDETELSADVDEYYKSQLEWIDTIDRFLQDNVNELRRLGLKLGTIYYFYLRTMVLDNLYIRCYTLRRLFKAAEPSSVTFVSNRPKDVPLDLTLQSLGRSNYSQVIPIVCSDRNIPLSSVFLKQNGRTIGEMASVRSSGNLAVRLAITLYARSATVRRIHFAYKYFGEHPRLKREDREGLNILILKTDHIGRKFIFDAMRRGHNVYQLSDSSILKYSSLGAKIYLHLKMKRADSPQDSDNKSIWDNTASLLDGHDLIQWVNQKCQLDVSQIVLPKLRHFVTRVCPEILEYFKVFVEFYRKAGIYFVITPHEVSIPEFAAIAAANHSAETKSVCVQHGDSIFASKMWNITELSHFDIYIASNYEMEEYFRYQCQENNIQTELYCSSHRLSNVKTINHLRDEGMGNIRENRIIFLPTFLIGDQCRLEGAAYPDTWYYKFQKSLIEHFSTRPEYTFVWKGLPQAEPVHNPIPDFIADNSFGNVEIATNPFVKHLLSADRVICDFPSTGFYESVIAGLPTMSLYHKASIVRRSAVEHFGNLLKQFSDIPEAMRHIDEFLSSDPGLYITTVDMSDESILNILEKIAKRSIHNSPE